MRKRLQRNVLPNAFFKMTTKIQQIETLLFKDGIPDQDPGARFVRVAEKQPREPFEKQTGQCVKAT